MSVSPLIFCLLANRLEVVAIEGDIGEHVPLAIPLKPKVEPSQWIASLETTMKNTLGSQLQACLETRLRRGKISQ